MVAAPHPAPVSDIADPAQALLLERELRGLRTMTWARVLLLVLWAPLAWVLGDGAVDRVGTLILLSLYLGVVFYSRWAVARRRQLRAVGLLGCTLDVLTIALLPLIWYVSLGGSELPFGIMLKSSVVVMALMLISLNTLAVRPLYPALVAAGAVLVHLAMVALALLDPASQFTASYVEAYTLPLVSSGQAVTALVVLIFVGVLLTKLTGDARAMVVNATQLEKANTQLGRYFSPNLVARLVENPRLLRVGAERRELSFVFTDLAGFTALVDSEDPADLVPRLNEYLDGMVRIAFAHHGTVDKIVGDAVHVIFGAPVEQTDHGAHAVACALAMDAFAEGLRARDRDGLRLGVTRIGVTTGVAVVGNFGGDALFDYTAHGAAINLAARLESANKQLGTRLCVSAETVAKVDGVRWRPIGTLMLRGAAMPLAVFEPLPAGHGNAPAVERYRDAFRRLEDNDPSARAAFEALADDAANDPLVSLHLERLRRGETGPVIDLSQA